MDTESIESGVLSGVEGTLPKARPAFPPIKREKLADGSEVRKIPVPSHRYTPLKENWMKIFEPIVEHLKLQVCLFCTLLFYEKILTWIFRSDST